MAKILVILEVTPNEAGRERYLDLVESLKPLTDNLVGRISMRRFQDLSDPKKLLSLHVWDSEEAVAAWRNQAEHRLAQMEAREKLYDEYKITVAHVNREYTRTEREEAPRDSNAYHGLKAQTD